MPVVISTMLVGLLIGLSAFVRGTMVKDLDLTDMEEVVTTNSSNSVEFQRFLEAELNDESILTGFRQICTAIINNDLAKFQEILDSDEFWSSRPDDVLVIPEDIATTKLLLIAHMEGRLDICKIILGCPKFTVPISMPVNSPELALIIAFRDEGNEETISEFLRNTRFSFETLDKCIGLAQYYRDTSYLLIIFHSRRDILLFADLPGLIDRSTNLGCKHLALWLSEYYRYLLYALLCRDCIGCPDISGLVWRLGRAISHNMS